MNNLIDVSKYKFVIEPRYYFYGWSRSNAVLGRKTVVEQLAKARSYLPKGYNFKIWDMYRPRSVQIQMLNSFARRIKQQHPKWSKKRIWETVYKFGAKPVLLVTRMDTHRHGGAVDLTIVDEHSDELYMGTDHDDLTKKAETKYFERLTPVNALQKEAKKNRRLLVKSLSKAGFNNYSAEWWHWSSNL